MSAKIQKSSDICKFSEKEDKKICKNKKKALVRSAFYRLNVLAASYFLLRIPR